MESFCWSEWAAWASKKAGWLPTSVKSFYWWSSMYSEPWFMTICDGSALVKPSDVECIINY
jgi:hypothetical protein